MKYKIIRGFHDILPGEIERWHFIENAAREVFESYGFNELRLPVIESTDIYCTGIGDTTDIVEKEMYTFDDRDGSSLTLRPEGTAGVVRSFIENSFYKKSPVSRFYYIGPMFRHERPQKGRYRGFNQIGCEFFGSANAAADAEIILMLWYFFQKIGFTDSVKIEINSIGDEESRNNFKTALVKYLTPLQEGLCDQCKRKLVTNPLRILDCKNKSCKDITKEAPKITDYLSDSSSLHFKMLIQILGELSVPYTINDKIVRGLDYYTETVFEFTTDKLGSQNAVAAGGRYNNLVEKMGGPSTPATGFALGLERIVLLHEQISDEEFKFLTDVYIAWIGEDTFIPAMKIATDLRIRGKSVYIEHDSKSIKSQLKRANKLEAGYTVIIGEEELKSARITVRNMRESSEESIGITDTESLFNYIT
jgi:histidyl-tRNA synthetase